MVPPATLVCCWDLLPSPQQLPPPSCGPDALHLQMSEREDNSIREKFESRQVARFYECSKPAKSDFRTKHLSKCIVSTRDGKKKKPGLEASRGRANVLGIRSTIMIFMCRAKYIWKKCQGLKFKRKETKKKKMQTERVFAQVLSGMGCQGEEPELGRSRWTCHLSRGGHR